MRLISSSMLSNATHRVDMFSKDDWNSTLSARNTSPSCLAVARQALPTLDLDCPLTAYWIFDVAYARMRYFGGQLIVSGLASDDPYEDRRSRIKPLIQLGVLLWGYRDYRPSVSQLKELHSTGQRGFAPDAGVALKMLDGRYELAWENHGGLLVVGLFEQRVLRPSKVRVRKAAKDSKDVHQEDEREREASIAFKAQTEMRRALGRLRDLFSHQRHFWDCVPGDIFSVDLARTDDLVKVFSDPLSFWPCDAGRRDVFLWPWQRCLSSRSRSEVVRHVPVETTSLVMDLRSSTAAMLVTRDPAEYANFIDEVVRVGRSIIVNHGGFFDKETGDGVIGHFAELGGSVRLNAALSQVPFDPVIYAVTAAKKMITEIDALCMQLQPKLVHGLDGVAPAIGLHTANSVWLISSGQIRAIGPAVVGAARLCGCCDGREVIVSNATLNTLLQSGGPSIINGFERRSVIMKEFSESASPYGFVWRGPSVGR
jgi:class 3 adenylate cyclase